MEQAGTAVSGIVNRKVLAGSSSLRNFTLALDDEQGLSLEAVIREGGPAIRADVVPACQLPPLSEAVCSVDWSWICGSHITRITVSEQAVQFQLDKAGPLKVSAGMWQGAPFLSFQPFKPAKA